MVESLWGLAGRWSSSFPAGRLRGGPVLESLWGLAGRWSSSFPAGRLRGAPVVESLWELAERWSLGHLDLPFGGLLWVGVEGILPGGLAVVFGGLPLRLF